MIIRTIDALIAGRSLVSVRQDATVRTACGLLNDHNVGALAAMDGGALTGIMSERDVIRQCLHEPGALDRMRVSDIMTRDPVTIRRSAGLADAMARMQDGGFRHLPVLDDDGRVVGMISLRDIPTSYRMMAERFREYTDGDIPA